MHIYYQKVIQRADLKKNRETLFIFGDNTERIGAGGQAREMRGEPNAFGIATLWIPGRPFTDENYKDATRIITSDISRIEAALAGPHYAGICFPADGIGTGLSCLAHSAPAIKDFLDQALHHYLGITNG